MTDFGKNKKSYAVIIAAVAVTLTVMISGIITGLVLAVRQRKESAEFNDNAKLMAGYLLRDSAGELRGTMSALRLCNDDEPAKNLTRLGLVHAVRAETALECHVDDWAENRAKEQFLNDMATVLHDYTPKQAMELADTLYEFTDKFYESVTQGVSFEYDGQLIPAPDKEPDLEVTEKDKEAAAELIKSALALDRSEYVGDYNGHIEFFIERDGHTGYAVTCGEKITEFSFMRDEHGELADKETAKRVALETAKACGYDGLSVRWCEVTGKSVTVIMCKTYDGAEACDDCATAVLFGDTVVAFTAGNCEHEHTDVPKPKINEADARKSAKNGKDGRLVVHTVNGEERICYEYRYELEDGVHYVYVCAENGKQIEVK